MGLQEYRTTIYHWLVACQLSQRIGPSRCDGQRKHALWQSFGFVAQPRRPLVGSAVGSVHSDPNSLLDSGFDVVDQKHGLGGMQDPAYQSDRQARD
jgi:hypothetical protein